MLEKQFSVLEDEVCPATLGQFVSSGLAYNLIEEHLYNYNNFSPTKLENLLALFSAGADDTVVEGYLTEIADGFQLLEESIQLEDPNRLIIAALKLRSLCNGCGFLKAGEIINYIHGLFKVDAGVFHPLWAVRLRYTLIAAISELCQYRANDIQHA